MKISVIGLGVIGASIAKCLSTKHEILGIDIDELTVEKVNKSSLGFEASTDTTLIQNSDVIILAIYPSLVKGWVASNYIFMKQGALIMDTSGVKSAIMTDINNMNLGTIDFIGFHPMAGKEQSGLAFSTKDMFLGANIIIVSDHDQPLAIATATTIANDLNAAKTSVLSPGEHDEIIGFLSQLTHVIAICLMNTNNHPLLVDYTGDSFRDLTRIARINETLWTELFQMNKPQLINQINLFQEELEAFKGFLEEEDQESMYQKMRVSTKRRILFDKK